MNIRSASSKDNAAILDLLEIAFGQKEEAVLVDDLLVDESAWPMINMIAEENEKVVGHILFTRAIVEGSDDLHHILAPLAVHPDFQERGIGKSLIDEGLRQCAAIGSVLVFVLGDPSYYTRYGFAKDAGKKGYAAPFTLPEKWADAWMFQCINNTESNPGKVQCANAMNKEHYWRE